MNVVVPHGLTAGRLVVLPNVDSVATERSLHGDRGVMYRLLHRFAEGDGHLVDVLVVLVRDDQRGTWIIRGPPRVHLHEHLLVSVQDLERVVSVARRDVATERACVPGRGVADHDAIVAR